MRQHNSIFIESSFFEKFLIRAFVCTLFCSISLPAVFAQSNSQQDDEIVIPTDVPSLIEGLGHKKYLMRDGCFQALKKKGSSVLEPLAIACLSEKAEIAFRCRKLLTESVKNTKQENSDKVHLLLKSLVIAGVEEMEPTAKNFTRILRAERTFRVIDELRRLGAKIDSTGRLQARNPFGPNRGIRIQGGFQVFNNGRNGRSKGSGIEESQAGREFPPEVIAAKDVLNRDDRKTWVKQILAGKDDASEEVISLIEKAYPIVSRRITEKQRKGQSEDGFRSMSIDRNGRMVNENREYYFQITIQEKKFSGTGKEFLKLLELPVKFNLIFDEVSIDQPWVDSIVKLTENEKVYRVECDQCFFGKKEINQLLELVEKKGAGRFEFQGRAVLGVHDNTNFSDPVVGAPIMDVTEESGAMKAGLESEDIITEIDGIKIKSFDHLRVAISAFRPGDTVVVKFLRGKEKKTAKVTLTGRF